MLLQCVAGPGRRHTRKECRAARQDKVSTLSSHAPWRMARAGKPTALCTSAVPGAWPAEQMSTLEHVLGHERKVP